MGYFSHILDINTRFMAKFRRHRRGKEASIKKDLEEAKFEKVDWYYRISLITPSSVTLKYICIYVCLYMFRLVN
jgi:hypothetical protein